MSMSIKRWRSEQVGTFIKSPLNLVHMVLEPLVEKWFKQLRKSIAVCLHWSNASNTIQHRLHWKDASHAHSWRSLFFKRQLKKRTFTLTTQPVFVDLLSHRNCSQIGRKSCYAAVCKNSLSKLFHIEKPKCFISYLLFKLHSDISACEGLKCFTCPLFKVAQLMPLNYCSIQCLSMI